MHLALIIAVLATMTIAESAPREPVADGAPRLLLALCAVAALTLFAAAFSTMTARAVRQDYSRRALWLRCFGRLKRVHLILWLAVVGGILWCLGWVQLVRFNWQLDGSFLLDELLILTPVLLPLLLAWAAYYEVDRALQLAAAPSRTALAISRRRYLTLHARHFFGPLLIPVLAMLAVEDLAEIVAPGIRESDQAWLVYLPLLALVTVGFPVILRTIWHTEPLPPCPLRDRLEATAWRAGVAVRDILVWKTDHFVVNAAVAGFVPQVRYVFLTDGLLSHLTDDEIAAVFSHELGHIRYHHLPLRIVALLVPICLWTTYRSAQGVVHDDFPHVLNLAQMGPDFTLEALLPVAVAACIVVMFAWYSRLLEHQADLWACRSDRETSHAAERPCHEAVHFLSALEKLATTSGTGRSRGGWLHPSIARRVQFIQQATANPLIADRFHRRTRLINSLLIGVVVSVLYCGLAIS